MEIKLYWWNILQSPFFRGIKIISFSVAIFFLGAIFLTWFGLIDISQTFLGVSLIFIGIGLEIEIVDRFIRFSLLKITPKISLVKAMKLSEAHTSGQALKEKANLGDYLEVPGAARAVFLGLPQDLGARFILARANLLSLVKGKEPDLDPSSLILESARIAAARGKELIEGGDLVLALYKTSPSFQKKVFETGLKEEDLKNIVEWERRLEKEITPPSFWERETLGSGIGREWSAGYTPSLNIYGRDISYYFTGDIGLQIFGKTREIEEVERILARSGKQNVLLVGEPGVGKKTIVNGLAHKIIEGNTLPPLRYKHVYQLDVGRLLAGAGKGEIEARLQEVLTDAAGAGNVILFIDDFEALVSGSDRIGGVNASELLIPFLKSSRIQIVGTTTPEAYHQNISPELGLASQFERVEVNEPTPDQTLNILEEVVPPLEYREKVFFTYQSLKEAIRLASRYVHAQPFPEKAIRVLDETAVLVAGKKKTLVLPEDVAEVVKQRTNIPVGEVETEEKEKLLDLEKILHQRIVDQDEAIQALAQALRRARSGMKRPNRPVGSFLFLGPTGVGKTETSKALAQAYFAKESRMVRLDMSEYKTAEAVAEIKKGTLTQSIKDDPFSLILLDEIEKAHPDILNLFLQLLDEGRLTDHLGRLVDFTNTIIIATSNAGAEMIREKLLAKVDYETLRKTLVDQLLRQGVFRPEFVNRFDAVIVFHPLGEKEVKEITKLILDEVRGQLKAKDIALEVSEDGIAKLAKLGFDPVLGARPLRRVIQEKIENKIADKLLKEEVKRGGKIVFGAKDIA